MKKILALSPHPDDIELGAGGFLLKQIQLKNQVDIVYCYKEKVQEVEHCSNLYNYNSIWLYNTSARPTHNAESVKLLDNIMSSKQYTHLLIPHSGERHQDHKTINNLAVSSARRFRGCVLQYEVCEYTNDNYNFKPNIFVGIDETFDKKMQWANFFSDVDANTLNTCKGLNILRAKNTNQQYAEAFELLKWSW